MKRRVGFVSSGFHDHVVGNLFRRWPQLIGRDAFEVHVFDLSGVDDAHTRRLRQGVDHYVAGLADTAAWIAALRHARLDVLVHLDVGLVPLSQTLASFRFAPLQLCAWGHPVTTGQSEIDRFLSSEWMEPPNGDRDYTEQVVRLPGMGTWMDLPAAEPVSTDVDGPVRFLCPQAAFKLSAPHDELFAAVLAAAPGSTLTLVPSRSEFVRAAIEARVGQCLAQHGVDRSRLHVSPYLAPADFERLLAKSHVVLDTLDWSGGVSSLAAMRHALPIVTWPRGAMRGHQTAGMLRGIGVADTIVSSATGYVDVAQKLAGDAAYRRDLRARLAAAYPRLAEPNERFRAALVALLGAAG